MCGLVHIGDIDQHEGFEDFPEIFVFISRLTYLYGVNIWRHALATASLHIYLFGRISNSPQLQTAVCCRVNR